MNIIIKTISSLTLLLVLFLFSCKKKSDPVLVSKSAAREVQLLSFTALSPAVKAVIDPSTKTFKAEVPSGTDLDKLVPTITVSGKATVSPASGVVQDFTKTVTYTG